MWYAGIDWADDHHDAVVLDHTGRRCGALRVPHTHAGLTQLVTWLGAFTASEDGHVHPDEVACVIETNHGLLIAALLEANLTVYPVNPKTIDRHRKPSGAKTDAIDAYLLARLGRNDLSELQRLMPDHPVVRELKALTRDQDMLIQSQTRLVNQLTACLKAYYPGVLPLFAKLRQGVTIHFLRTYPTLDAARAASVDELTSVLRQGKHPQPHVRAEVIWQALHAPQLEADDVTTRTKARLMLALINQLVPVMEAIAAYDAEILQVFATHPDSAVFASVPGTGRRLAPRLLAEWGDDRTRYGHAGAVQALAGTAPVMRQSGAYARAQLRRACIKPLRQVLYQVAWQSLRREDWARTYYKRKRAEGKRHSAAVRALANTWVRIMYAMWQRHTPYCAATFHAAQQAHQGTVT